MWQGVSAALAILAKAMGWIDTRNTLNNTPQMQSAAIKADQQKTEDEIRKSVADKDADATRKDIAQ